MHDFTGNGQPIGAPVFDPTCGELVAENAHFKCLPVTARKLHLCTGYALDRGFRRVRSHPLYRSNPFPEKFRLRTSAAGTQEPLRRSTLGTEGIPATSDQDSRSAMGVTRRVRPEGLPRNWSAPLGRRHSASLCCRTPPHDLHYMGFAVILRPTTMRASARAYDGNNAIKRTMTAARSMCGAPK
jgi:hypothetical protein